MEKQSISALDILKKVQEKEYGFSVCQDEMLTQKVKDMTDQTNWEAIKNKNQKEHFSFSSKSPSKFDWSDFLLKDMEECEKVSSKILDGTRFKSLKRMVLRVIKVSTQWQEKFNGLNLNFLRQLISQISRLESELLLAKDKLKSLEIEADAFQKNIITLSEGREQRFNETIELIKNNENKVSQINKHFEEIQEHAKSNQKSIELVSNQICKITSDIEDHEHQISDISSKVTTNQEIINSLEEQIHACENNVQNSELWKKIEENEKWLTEVTTRVSNNEEWLKLVSEQLEIYKNGFRELREEMFWELGHSVKQLSGEIEKGPFLKQSLLEKQKKLQEINLNIGSGEQNLDGYINVDMRNLPNVDIVSDALHIPFQFGEVNKIFASHLLEHFTRIQAEKELLPYWYNLLKKSGELILILPNIGFMAEKYSAGEIPFKQLALLISGGQEYEGNYHLAVYNPETVQKLLEKVGFENVEIAEKARKNGECWEMEIHARK